MRTFWTFRRFLIFKNSFNEVWEVLESQDKFVKCGYLSQETRCLQGRGRFRAFRGFRSCFLLGLRWIWGSDWKKMHILENVLCAVIVSVTCPHKYRSTSVCDGGGFTQQRCLSVKHHKHTHRNKHTQTHKQKHTQPRGRS